MTQLQQTRVEELRTEVEQLEARASEYSVLKKPMKDQESALPEAERSEVEAELECPVCLGNYNNDLSFFFYFDHQTVDSKLF